ncbi:SGNH/GDSL hydrolase family protein [Parafilimonas sp.]|uniref:SGNH/GDSL hydrolase family protein n=1 Tax=Parafilimonas sp. TaxID=1969739 RepID=UPI0039E44C06
MRSLSKVCIVICLLFLLQKIHAQDTLHKRQDDSAWIRFQQYIEYMIHNDWANLSKYKDANTVLGLPAPGEKRIVFIGNSITEGWFATDSVFFTKNKYINRGIGGQTTPQMLVRFRADVISLKPAAVVILAGTNDIAGNTGPSTLEMIENNIASMADLAKAHHIRVILCAVLPVYDYPWKPGLQPAEKIETLNAWIKQYVANNDCLYADYWTPLADERKGMKAGYAKDGVHPTMAGYKIMEPIVQRAINEALSSQKR